MTLFALGMIHGLDNAAVALVLGPLLGWRRGFALAAMFALAETAMPLAGFAFAGAAGGLDGEVARAGALALLATTIAGVGLARRDPARLVGSPAAMAALALLLGLDNLAAGSVSADPVAAVSLGLGSALVAAAACAIGAALGGRASPAGRAALAAGGLAALAFAAAAG